MTVKPIVLFLCSHNSARSIMAEAILRSLAGDRFEVHSAGLHPSRVHPLTLRVLEEEGLETAGLRSKGADTYLGRVSVKHAIIVCERAASECPSIYPFALEVLEWPFPDPSRAEGSEDERLDMFRSVFLEIRDRISQWLEVPVSNDSNEATS